jgi:hypothetical protein
VAKVSLKQNPKCRKISGGVDSYQGSFEAEAEAEAEIRRANHHPSTPQ